MKNRIQFLACTVISCVNNQILATVLFVLYLGGWVRGLLSCVSVSVFFMSFWFYWSLWLLGSTVVPSAHVDSLALN